MSREIITNLTVQEEQLSFIVRQQWLSLLTKPIQKKKVVEIINNIYQNKNYKTPEIIFADSPKSAYQILKYRKENNKIIGSQLDTLIDEKIEHNLRQQVQGILRRKLEIELDSRLRYSLWDRLYSQFWLPLEDRLKKQFGKKKRKISFDLSELGFACYFDFLQQIGIDFEREYCDLYIDFLTNISLYLAFENLVIIIERPIELNWNEAGKLHAEGKPAIKFRDGYNIYAYNGTQMPAKYGKLNPNKWASTWLTKDKDSELIPYIEKWQQICFSTERIDSEQAIQLAKEIYKLMDYPEPEVILFASPGAVIQKMDCEEDFSEHLGKSLESQFRKKFWDVFSGSLQNQLEGIWLKLGDKVHSFPSQLDDILLRSNDPTYQLPYWRQSSIFWEFLTTNMNFLWTYEEENYEDCDEEEEDEDCDEEFTSPLKDSSDPMSVNWDEVMVRYSESFSPQENNRMSAVLDCNISTHFFLTLCEIDFCVSELKCRIDLPKWNAWKRLMTHCCSVWFYENACIICDRPTKVSFDNRGRLHDEGSPAIQFADGFSVYAFQNVRLPEKYGKVHPSQWETQWLLEGNSAEITQILIENIGYERINRELNEYQLTARDKYELLRTNLYDKVNLTNSISSQELARNYIDLKSLPSYEFEVVTVDFKGKTIATEKKKNQIFTEDLSNNVSLEMVAIPGGEFLMGTAHYNGEENPQHLVKVSPFFLSKYPITQAQWRAVVSMPKVKLDLDLEPSHFQGDNLPVESITKQEAIEFCTRLWQYTGRLYSLPTEAQWEYACRANTTTPFHFGETITTDLANYDGAKYSYEHEPAGIFRQETLPVGSFPANALGLYDLYGNVFEFCADNWHENYQDAPNNDKSRTGGNDECAPIRGGGWKSFSWLCSSANRNDDFRKSDIKYSDIGFRLAFTPTIFS